MEYVRTENTKRMYSYKKIYNTINYTRILFSMTCTQHRLTHLDAVPPIHVVSNHVDTDKLTTANGGTFTSS